MSNTIVVTVNGEQKSLADGMTAEKLVHELALTGQRIAIEINGEIVPRSTFGQHCIVAGDRIEIVRAVGGG